MSVGWLLNAQINLHDIDNRERIALVRWSKLSLIEYITINNQNLQIDPVVAYLRAMARLTIRGDPDYGAIEQVINELKIQIQKKNLTAKLLYMMIRPYIWLESHVELMNLITEFFQMLIVNDQFNNPIGPPAFLLWHGHLQNEKMVWASAHQLQLEINQFMKQSDVTPKKRRRFKMKAGI